MHDFAALRQLMVDNQIRPGSVSDYEVIKAFLAVPREEFVSPADRPFAYADRELALPASAGTRRTIMPPVQLARLVQALPLTETTRALIVGCGTGYSAAIVAHLAGAVIALEEDPALVAQARALLQSLPNVAVVTGKLADGYPVEAPYDAMLVDGTIEVLPGSLVTQLKPGGLLAAIERDDRVSRAKLYERVGTEAAGWPLFDAWSGLLPGFARPREFVF